MAQVLDVAALHCHIPPVNKFGIVEPTVMANCNSRYMVSTDCREPDLDQLQDKFAVRRKSMEEDGKSSRSVKQRTEQSGAGTYTEAVSFRTSLVLDFTRSLIGAGFFSPVCADSRRNMRNVKQRTERTRPSP